MNPAAPVTAIVVATVVGGRKEHLGMAAKSAAVERPSNILVDSLLTGTSVQYILDYAIEKSTV